MLCYHISKQPSTDALMESQTPPLLTVEHLTLSLNAEVKIHDLCFTLHAGERLCLLGASGSGKSLTAAAILGTLPVGASVSGSIRLQGQEVNGLRLQRRKKTELAAIFQDPFTSLNPLTTVGQQLMLALRSQNALTKRQAQHCAAELLSALGMSPDNVMPPINCPGVNASEYAQHWPCSVRKAC